MELLATIAPAADDDDDLDLFGNETEEEAAEEREASKKSAKKNESGKSYVLVDIKPWDDETDMKKLEESVRSIEMPGLFWGASKLVPVGYGIKKLQIMLTIVDDLVSVDILREKHLTAEPRTNMFRVVTLLHSTKFRQQPFYSTTVRVSQFWPCFRPFVPCFPPHIISLRPVLTTAAALD